MTQERPISQKIKKRRQLLLVLPLLILPFVTLAFWAMGGGGGGGEEDGKEQQAARGINSEVPRANVSFRPEDKMSLYAKADRKAEARKQALAQFRYPVLSDSSKTNNGLIKDEDPNSLKVEQKLADLQRILDVPRGSAPSGMSSVSSINPANYGLQPGEEPQMESADRLNKLNQLNDLIARSAESDGDESGDQDRDMQQINTMLDKILAIQHPEKAPENLQKLSRTSKGRVYGMQLPAENLEVPFLHPAVNAEKAEHLVRSVWNTDSIGQLTGDNIEIYNRTHSSNYRQPLTGAFFDIDPEETELGESHYTVQAVIAASQTLVSGAAIKMRLTADVLINGTLIPKGNFVYGTSTVNGERLKVAINHIRFQNQIFPVHLTVYDLDGMEGIRIPGAIGRDASKAGADRALQSVQMMSLDPSITAQAAAAGIEATKGLLSKKVKLVRVTVKAGYPILLLDEQGLQKDAQ